MDAILRRAWWVLLGISAVVGLLGLGDLLIGASFEPSGPLAISGRSLAEVETQHPEVFRIIDLKARTGGVDLLALGALLSAVVWYPYRARQRWSWFAMWVLPIWAVSFVLLPLAYGLAAGQSVTGAMMSGPMLAVLAAVALLVDSRRFRGHGLS